MYLFRRYATDSRKWINRQINDPFVKEAQKLSYRSRASFKLIELIKMPSAELKSLSKYRAVECIIKKGQKVLDLGASPGGWSQIAKEAVGETGTVVAVDKEDMDALRGVIFVKGDILNQEVIEQVRQICNGRVNVLLSDMAPGFSGSSNTDADRVTALCETALEIATKLLQNHGLFICKFIQGPSSSSMIQTVRRSFATVDIVKPAASRSESAEAYLVCHGFTRNLSQEPEQEIQPMLMAVSQNLKKHSDPNNPTTVNLSPAVPPPPPIPHWSELKPGVRVLGTLKNGQPLVGTVDSLLSRDYHSKGFRVRLSDCNIVRVNKVLY